MRTSTDTSPDAVDLYWLPLGVVATGAVGTRWLGRSRWFRYGIRCWAQGAIPDVAEAVDSPLRLSTDSGCARRLLDLVPHVPTPVWGRDADRSGDMWNSNSVIAWLLVSSGIETAAIRPPRGGRAPGWDAGLAIAGAPRRGPAKTVTLAA